MSFFCVDCDGTSFEPLFVVFVLEFLWCLCSFVTCYCLFALNKISIVVLCLLWCVPERYVQELSTICR